MKRRIENIYHRAIGIVGCLLDLGIQIMLSAASMFRKDPELEDLDPDTEDFYHNQRP